MKQPQDEPYHVTIQIENKLCKVSTMLKDLGVQRFEVDDLRSLTEDLTRHLVRMPSKQIHKVPRSVHTKAKSRTKGKIEGKTSIWFDSEGCDVCKTILSYRSFLISGRSIKEDTIIYTFVAPNFEAFRRILSTLEEKGLQPKILEVGQFKPKGEILTEKQERALWFALKMGFFEYPRKITMLELSRRLGIGLSTLSETTRRGIRRLLKNHFES